MKKKDPIKIIRPSECINSLQEFNNRVLGLVTMCDSMIKMGLVDKKAQSTLKDSVDAVKEFYPHE